MSDSEVPSKDPVEEKPIHAPAPKPRARAKKAPDLPVIERRNWLIHQHFIRKEYETCKSLIKEQLTETGGECEYAMYIQAIISRSTGNIEQSTELLQACAKINPGSAENLKQIAKNLFLVGKYKNALECYQRAMEISERDWEIVHHLGVCHLHLKEYDTAEQCLREAIDLNRHDITFSTLANLYLETQRLDKAVEVLKKGVEFSPENIDMLTTLGLLYLRMQDFHKAFELLGQAMTFDPENYKAILAAGSLMQIHGDYDVALTKYRVAAQKAPESAALWNNIAMCFFGKKKYIAAISCLKRATYLAPFDWKILYNLSLLHVTMQQYASAFQFASSALKLKPRCGALFMLLAICLNHLGDTENARKSYEQAVELESDDPYTLLNYANFLHQHKDTREAQKILGKLEKMIENQKSDVGFDTEIIEVSRKLGAALHVGDRFVKSAEERQNPAVRERRKKSARSSKEPSPVTQLAHAVEEEPPTAPTPSATSPFSSTGPLSPSGRSLPPLKPRQSLPSVGATLPMDEKLLAKLPEAPTHQPEASSPAASSSKDLLTG